MTQRPYGIHVPQVLDRLYRELESIHRCRADALAAMGAANRSGDDAAWDAASAEHDRLSDEMADTERRIAELEGE